MGRLHASERLTRIGSWMDATPPLVSLVEGGDHGRRQTQDGGAEDKLRGVSVRIAVRARDLISAQGTHTAQEGGAARGQSTHAGP